MRLIITDPRTVALVDELTERTGASPTRAIEDAVRQRLARLDSEAGHRETAARLARARQVLAELDAQLTDDDRKAIRAAEHDLYDDAGLPR
ncbi:type II toxin-antitoxin system VapB family antitoxin [Demequina subtropica]|uniref:type II toxin-antitoxin system VapB family antitoxin n=1 Tax=Demequina subtropica TaxID=1638989 RepID=UPI000780759B|nr:type II toxin-antitoxin system VapB family antitoxin [Demequina subtropica]